MTDFDQSAPTHGLLLLNLLILFLLGPMFLPHLILLLGEWIFFCFGEP